MTTGEGVMITTNDDKIAELVRSLKNFGRDNSNHNICVNPEGNNFKVTEFTGLLGSLECERVAKRIQKRNLLTDVYINRLKGSSYTPVVQKSGLSSQYKMILRITSDREFLREFCKKNGITLTGEVYQIPVHQQPLYKEQFKKLSFPVTDIICRMHICPPLYPELSVEEINYICDVLLQAEKEYEK
jgi:dTDP-4-amino-4,6-dideoxygalactose transaminase